MPEPRRFCHACAMPLDIPGFQGKSDIYCNHCTDEEGKLIPREDVQKGIARWFLAWQGDIDEARALARADHDLRAMPAWADD